MDALWGLLAIGVCAVMWYLAYRIEPHHVSKDGSRFLASGQLISTDGKPDGRRHEVWVRVMPDSHLEVEVKRRMRRNLTHWAIEGKADHPSARRAVYVLRIVSTLGVPQRMIVRMPARSRAVPIMDEAMAGSRSI